MGDFNELNYIERSCIECINEVVNKHPISWEYIATAVKEAIPLIDHMGPDGLLIAVINEKKRRYIDEG